jgi:hypothetical protein
VLTGVGLFPVFTFAADLLDGFPVYFSLSPLPDSLVFQDGYTWGWVRPLRCE